ncbi:uncharacterized protein LOC127158926 [Labeo rohita]|uniref:uncharacterized protein LOC127158926 n=1 Tax=Labeo rohita TaxID=84645 RepID=UPI0021E26F29|nr:uncharacterized protein LOC127158926 [Labeo rohita]XP_050957918.1 uncharacterized protein LOC127158926 [Labeo rohita]
MTNLTRISGSLHRLTVRVCSTSPLPFCRNNVLYSHSFSESATAVRCFTRDSRYRSSNRHYASSAHKTVRIGCASGFWGDTATSVPQLIYGGKLDFLVFDYLSEITMSLLSAAKAKAPNMGYAPDFVLSLSPFIKDISKKGIRVVSNAGGVNPLACGAALQEVVQKAGLDLKVAVVTGDDLMPQKDSLTELRMADSEGRKPLPKTVHSMNAYLGALPIKRCLDLGADIVVTGRCVDSAVVLGPLMHSFAWDCNNYDLLAAGSLAGHLIECGAQATGGIFTDWHTVPDWDNMGFPVVECSADGSFTLSKPPKTGGLVSFGTVAEQLVYEIGDPQRYLLPDVTCDFSNVTITEIPDVDGGTVKVGGAKGSPPSGDYKVCATYMDGFRATAVCPVGGPRAVEKARRTAESIIKRTQRIFKQLGLEDYAEVNIQVLGAEDTYGPHAANTSPREAVVWMAVHHKQKKALEFFSREVAPAGTGMAPGLTAIVGGRPRISPVLKPFFFLHPKADLEVHIHVNGELVETHREAVSDPSLAEGHDPSLRSEEHSPTPTDLPSGPHTFRLEELAYTRSGDKGDSSNIGVIARHPLYFPYLKKCLTAEVVEQYFQHLIRKDQTGLPSVKRYELPGIHGLNFILPNSLGGGGVASLRSDPQGKAYGQMLLDYKLRGLPDLKSLVD